MLWNIYVVSLVLGLAASGPDPPVDSEVRLNAQMSAARRGRGAAEAAPIILSLLLYITRFAAI